MHGVVVVRRIGIANSLPSASLHLIPRTMSTEIEPQTGKQNQKASVHPGCHRDMRRTFYIDAVVDKVMKKSLGHPFLMWTRTRAEWYRLLKSEAGCRALVHSRFLAQLRKSMQEDEFEATKRFGSEKVCLARSFAEHKRIKRDLYVLKYRSLAAAAASDALEKENLRAFGLGDAPSVVDWLGKDSEVAAHEQESEEVTHLKDGEDAKEV